MFTAKATSMVTASRPSCRGDFSIAILCALPGELDAITLLVDEFWDQDGDGYGRAPGDTNTYTTGRMAKHNVVMLCIPGMGTSSAASSVASLRSSFNNLRLVLVVGICGGVPQIDGHDAFLGDVVVSKTIIQYDYGRQYPGRFSTRTNIEETLGRPHKDIRSLLATIESEHGRDRLRIKAAAHLGRLGDTAARERRRANYSYPGAKEDKLYRPEYTHSHHVACEVCSDGSHACEQAAKASCADLGCDEAELVARDDVINGDFVPNIFVGRIASGNTIMRSGRDRDRIAAGHGIIAFEMEGAGAADELPCIVVKGLCDYADSHKNKKWQDFAAATASSVARAMLERYALVDRITAPAGIDATSDPRVLRARASHASLPKQVQFQLVTIIDARGWNLPIHLETICSRHVLIEVLRHRFRDLGTRKIDRGEWFFEDLMSGHRLDLSQPWEKVFKPNQTVVMYMVFRRRNEHCTDCPSCGFSNTGLSTDEVLCSRCGVKFRRVEEVHDILINNHGDQGHHTYPNSESCRPSYEKPRASPSELRNAEDITRYKQVQLVDVDFKVGRTEDSERPGSCVALHLARGDLRNSKRIALIFSQVYGLSDLDSMVLAEAVLSKQDSGEIPQGLTTLEEKLSRHLHRLIRESGRRIAELDG